MHSTLSLQYAFIHLPVQTLDIHLAALQTMVLDHCTVLVNTQMSRSNMSKCLRGDCRNREQIIQLRVSADAEVAGFGVCDIVLYYVYYMMSYFVT